MAKIAQVSAKYIIHADIHIEGVVDKPDVIGAVFGQTEGLLGSELELRELQKSGRIGRIEVNTETAGGKTKGSIIVPSSLDKAETAIVGASLEVIQRIGPCNSVIKVIRIEDIRISKRKFLIDRAKQLLKDLMNDVLPDSQELSDEVTSSVRVMEITEYGKDRLPAGPSIDDADEVILVEGRADVLNLLKHGFKNVIAMNGAVVPKTIIDLAKQKTIIAFVDGDRGGDLNVLELIQVSEIDFVTKAPDGKEVEELTKKEIHKALRSKVAAEQAKLELGDKKDKSLRTVKFSKVSSQTTNRNVRPQPRTMQRPSRPLQRDSRPPQRAVSQKQLNLAEKKKFSKMLEDLLGTRGAYILDPKLNILGKVPSTELETTMKSLTSGVYAVIFDGAIEKNLLNAAERINLSFLIGMASKVGTIRSRVSVLTIDDLQ
jgi:DNA primase